MPDHSKVRNRVFVSTCLYVYRRKRGSQGKIVVVSRHKFAFSDQKASKSSSAPDTEDTFDKALATSDTHCLA